jgi:hypothetical protein
VVRVLLPDGTVYDVDHELIAESGITDPNVFGPWLLSLRSIAEAGGDPKVHLVRGMRDAPLCK